MPPNINGLSQLALNTPNAFWSAQNEIVYPDDHFDGKRRWLNGKQFTRITADASNPHGLNAITHRFTAVTSPASITTGGKAIYLADAGLEVGQILTGWVECRPADGIWQLSAQCWSASDALVGSAVNTGTQFAGTGAVVKMATQIEILATTAYVMFYLREVTAGATRINDTYEWWATPGQFLPLLPAPMIPAELRRGRQMHGGIFPDPLHRRYTPGVDWRGRERWVNGSLLTRVTDSANRYNAQSLQFAYDAGNLFAGWMLWQDEMQIGTGDRLFASVELHGTLDENVALACRFYDVSSVFVGAQVDGPTVTLGGAGVLKVAYLEAEWPATAVKVKTYVIRRTLAVNTIKICAQSGYVVPLRAMIGASATEILDDVADARQGETSLTAGINALIAEASGGTALFPLSQDIYGKHLLRSWHAKLAKIKRGVAGTQAVIYWRADSIGNNGKLTNPIRDELQDRYGDAGPGYCSANTAITVPTGVTRNRTGTWTDRDNNTTPVGNGPALDSALSSEVGALVSWSDTVTNALILYVIQPDGGDFRYRVNAGGWTTVHTDGTLACGSEPVPQQPLGVMLVEIEIEVAGAAGVEIMGIIPSIDTEGVILHKCGNGGALAMQFALQPAAVVTGYLQAMAPDLIVTMLGTNDEVQDRDPDLEFGPDMETLIEVDQAALPLTDGLLIVPPINNIPGDFPMTGFQSVIRALAIAYHLACVDFLLHFNDWSDADTRGMFDDNVHPNDDGARALGFPVIDVLVVD